MDIDEIRRPSAKRPRAEPTLGTTPAGAVAPTAVPGSSLPMSAQQSIESLLSIPVAVVFRTCFSQEGRPLLTRTEAECFLRISFLAQEIDTLMGSSESIFLQQRYYSHYTQDLLLPSSANSTPSQPSASLNAASSQTSTNTRTMTHYLLHPMLRPLLSIVNSLQDKSTPTLQQIHQTLSHLSAELIGCASVLRQSAEQNWTMADALEALQQNDENGPSFSDEKRKVADLEEELCQRIERVVGMSSQSDVAAGEKSSAKLSQSSEGYRRQLFVDRDEEQEEGVDNEGNPQGKENALWQQQSESIDDGKDKLDQQYTLDLKPIAEFCSELFDNAVYEGGGSQEEEETGEGEIETDNGTNSSDHGAAEDRMHVDESPQGEREGPGNGNVCEDSSEKDRDNGSKGDSVAEHGEMEVDPVEARAEIQTCNRSSTEEHPEQQNVMDGFENEEINEGNEDTDHNTESENQSPKSSIPGDTVVEEEEVEEYSPTQEPDLQSGPPQEGQGRSFSSNQSIPSPNENEKHPAVLLQPIATQPEGGSFPLTAEDDIEEDDDDDNDDARSERPMCSQRTSSAAEALTILGTESMFPNKDISLY
ncbi:MAG: hypothetical protein SGBAC_000557 [Bacillariaceae sp.]